MSAEFDGTGFMDCDVSRVGASSIPIRESARTRIDVIGVLSSWETLETNSCLDWSTAFNFSRVLLMVSEICFVS